MQNLDVENLNTHICNQRWQNSSEVHYVENLDAESDPAQDLSLDPAVFRTEHELAPLVGCPRRAHNEAPQVLDSECCHTNQFYHTPDLPKAQATVKNGDLFMESSAGTSSDWPDQSLALCRVDSCGTDHSVNDRRKF